MFTELSLGCWLSGHPCIKFRLPQCFSLSVTCTYMPPYNVLLEVFVVVFQEINCLHTFKQAYVRQVTELHLSTKFHVCQCRG